MGGEHGSVSCAASSRPGSSPRGRGTQKKGLISKRANRFIPAWAGNTRRNRWTGRRAAVHPRVGGEHVDMGAAVGACAGSSPRGRGTRHRGAKRKRRRRFIPAWAGNTCSSATVAIASAVHPRVGGEHCARPCGVIGRPGSSPRGRGTRIDSGLQAGARRFIPAWAGNTRCQTEQRHRRPVHPRVGGEHGRSTAGGLTGTGSSPRGRGTHYVPLAYSATDRFIPAWAGNTEPTTEFGAKFTVHPRVGGEHGSTGTIDPAVVGSSPRGRGTRQHSSGSVPLRRFIPAWAGNTKEGTDF